jgi:aldose 1-epimerase
MRYLKPQDFINRLAISACGIVLAGAVLLFALFPSGCGRRDPGDQAGATGRFTYDFRVEKDSLSGHTVVTLFRQGGARSLEARIAPTAGANLFGLAYGPAELILGPASLEEFDGSRFGTPVLYPTPCRIPGGKFTFLGRKFDFGINRDDTHIHGLVRNVPWQYETPEVDQNGVSLYTWIEFYPGGQLYEKFGYDHALSLVYRLGAKGLRIIYEVANRSSEPLPYGFGFHPYFNYPGEREEVYLSVPATGRMLMENLIPTGGIAELSGKYDLRQSVRVADLVLDDVFTGMVQEQPAVIEWRDSRVRLTLNASHQFTHLIVYDQPENPFFCVENLTCSPDAYNLYARGFPEESGLKIVPPGRKSGGWVHYVVEEMKKIAN